MRPGYRSNAEQTGGLRADVASSLRALAGNSRVLRWFSTDPAPSLLADQTLVIYSCTDMIKPPKTFLRHPDRLRNAVRYAAAKVAT